jgi:dolichol-phosphate mannosyltransferase
LPASTVVVPTYNEANNIERIVGTVLSQSPDLSLLIVDDNSPDGTGDLARRLARTEKRLEVMHRPRKMGLGSAYREGFARILSRQTGKYLLEMDADFSHDPKVLPVLIETAEREQADLVIGSRYAHGGRIVGWDWKRRALSSAANKLCSLLLGSRVRDYTAGFRCYRAEALRLVDLASIRSEGYAFQVEMTTRMLKKRMGVVEVPIVFSERRTGASKFNSRIFIEAVLVLGLLFMKRLIA